MKWIFLSVVYCIVCILAVVFIRKRNKNMDPPPKTFGLVDWLVLILIAPLGIILSPFWLPFILVPHFKDKLKDRREKKEKERKENELKARIGLRPDENYECFSMMGGAGVITCRDCGYKEKITSFTHGMYSCTIGRQCPHCYSFVYEHNESKEYHTFGESKEDFVCPKCGTVIRKKEESILKGNDDPLFCPQCHSARLSYFMEYIT